MEDNNMEAEPDIGGFIRELDGFSKSHAELVMKLIGEMKNPMFVAATLHSLHAAMMESEMGIITQATESGAAATAYETKVSRKHANGEAEKSV